MTATINTDALEALISTLIDEPHEEHMPDLTFGEAMQIPLFGELLKTAVAGQRPAANPDEEALRVELVKFRLDDLTTRLKLVQSDRAGGPISAPWAREDLDHWTADFVQELAVLGIVSYLNRVATNKLQHEATAA